MVGLDKKSESNPFTSLKALTKARLETIGAAKHTFTKHSKVTTPPNFDFMCFRKSVMAFSCLGLPFLGHQLHLTSLRRA